MAATLQICKVDSGSGTWDFTVNSVSTNTVNSRFSLESDQCQENIMIPGEYVILEDNGMMATVSGDCDLSNNGLPIALVNLQAGETLICNFLGRNPNHKHAECVTTFLTEEELAEFFAIPVLIPQNIEELCEAIETELD
jgi:hypothetical protein